MRSIAVIWTLPLMAMISACDSPTVAGCEQFLKGTLKAPSTYKRVAVTEATEPLTRERLRNIESEMKPATFEILYPADGNYQLHRVVLTYQAANSFNAPIQSEMMCAFTGRDGQPPSRSSIRTSVMLAEAREDFRRTATDLGLDNVGAPQYPCCL